MCPIFCTANNSIWLHTLPLTHVFENHTRKMQSQYTLHNSYYFTATWLNDIQG